MAQQPRDGGQILSCVKDMLGEGVTQNMRRYTLQARSLSILANDKLHRLGLQWFTALADEEVVIADSGTHG